MIRITKAITVREPWAWMLVTGQKMAEMRSRPFPSNIPLPIWVGVHASTGHDFHDDSVMDGILSLSDDMWDILDHPRFKDKEGKNRIFGDGEFIGAVKIVDSIYLTPTDGPIEEDGTGMSQETKDAIHQIGAVYRRIADDPTSATGRQTERIDMTTWFVEGRHHWIVGDAIRFADTVACRGALNVWNIPPKVADLVNRSANGDRLEMGDAIRRKLIP